MIVSRGLLPISKHAQGLRSIYGSQPEATTTCLKCGKCGKDGLVQGFESWESFSKEAEEPLWWI